MQTRLLTAHVSKSPTDGSGVFEAIAYDRSALDVDGITLTERAMRSAVAAFRARGRPLVLRWAHDLDDPTAAIGLVTDMWTDGRRLYIRGEFDLTHAEGVAIYERVLVGTINELSVSWTAPDSAVRRRDGVEYVDEMELIEISFVAVGANRGTRVTSVKASGSPRAAPARSAPSTQVARVRAEIKRLVESPAPGPDIAAELAEHERRVEADRERRARAAEARAALERYHLANMGRPGTRVLVDARMRPTIPDDDARQAARREREQLEREARYREREREPAGADRRISLAEVGR